MHSWPRDVNGGVITAQPRYGLLGHRGSGGSDGSRQAEFN